MTNFGSYKELELDFSSEGLCLITGPTGSGKSTLCDIVPWILFGKTSKGGPVEEVINWNNQDLTTGCLYFAHKGSTIEIYRSRGRDGRGNDFYYQIGDKGLKRGKDLNDTQKLLNAILGFDLNTYLLGAYFNEFSVVSNFFTTTPRLRRAICDNLTDLSLAERLQERLTVSRKALEKESQKLKNDTEQLKAEENRGLTQDKVLKSKLVSYDKAKEQKLEHLVLAYNAFEQAKLDKELDLRKELAKLPTALELNLIDSSIASTNHAINAYKSVCSECGAPKQHKEKEEAQNQLNALKRKRMEIEYAIKRRQEIQSVIEETQTSQNTYLEQVESLKGEENPYTDLYKTNRRGIKGAREKATAIAGVLQELNARLLDTETLLELTTTFRGVLLSNVVSFLNDTTNTFLQDYFDGVFRVDIIIDEGTDAIDINIMKEGINCTFTQLSKGQRQLIKLCFSLSVILCIANQHGIKFSTLFLDEAMDGLDSSYKMKAYSLINSLTKHYKSIYMIDHSEELKAMIDNKLEVRLVNGQSSEVHSA